MRKKAPATAYYIRTSHALQNIGRQEEKIEPGWLVFKDEGVSGRVAFEDRPQGKKLLQAVRAGLVSEVRVDTLDRLGRSTENILQTIRQFHEHGVGVNIKKEGITTLVDGKENYVTRLLLSVLSSIAEMEYMRIKERTLEGIALGKRLGVYKGRKQGAVETPETFAKKTKVKKIKVMLEEGVSVRNICKVLECSPNYVSKVKERLELEV
jgi:DNA invertase Pin-like site-specific DNA recombinase